MQAHYDLDFALIFACVLALFGWLVSWLVPVVARALVAFTRRHLPRLRH